MINGRQEIKVGQYLSINGKQLLLAKIENDTVVLTGCNKTWIYGLEGFKRTIRQIGYELVQEE